MNPGSPKNPPLIEAQDYFPAQRAAKIGSWREVLERVVSWRERGVCPKQFRGSVEALCGSCLHKKGWKAIAALLDAHILTDVPKKWIVQVLRNKQDDLAAFLLRRCSDEVIRAGAEIRFAPVSWVTLAALMGCSEALKVLAFRGMKDPMALPLFAVRASVPVQARASEIVPQLQEMGGDLERFPEEIRMAMHRRFGWFGLQPKSLLQAAVETGAFQTAAALVTAGANPWVRVFDRSVASSPGAQKSWTTPVHLLMKSSVWNTNPDGLASGLLDLARRLANDVEWEQPDGFGSRPAEVLGPFVPAVTRHRIQGWAADGSRDRLDRLLPKMETRRRSPRF